MACAFHARLGTHNGPTPEALSFPPPPRAAVIEGEWATVAVLGEKGQTKETSNGRNYALWCAFLRPLSTPLCHRTVSTGQLALLISRPHAQDPPRPQQELS